MGIGPSTKETTLHHFNDPLVKRLQQEKYLHLAGIVVAGTPEIYADKLFIARRTADLVNGLRVKGTIVSIDSWGNSHVDFANTISQIALKSIQTVGVSFVGNQASFVVTNPYLHKIVDINKNDGGIETCVVGENNLTDMDALKAVSLLKYRLKRQKKSSHTALPVNEEAVYSGKLVHKFLEINHVRYSDKTAIENDCLFIEKDLKNISLKDDPFILEIQTEIVLPQQKAFFTNSILDFMPIAYKSSGICGEGETNILRGIAVLLTGAEESGFQPANIGSSEGILQEKVCWNRSGTPNSNDILLHIDITFRDGAARSRDGIRKAHLEGDRIVQKLRQCLIGSDFRYKKEFLNSAADNLSGERVVLVKLVSGLGCMYETLLFPDEPGGVAGATSIIESGNFPQFITPNQYLDGVIHAMC